MCVYYVRIHVYLRYPPHPLYVCLLFHAMLLTVHSMLTHPIYVSFIFLCVFAISCMHVHSGVCMCRHEKF